MPRSEKKPNDDHIDIKSTKNNEFPRNKKGRYTLTVKFKEDART